MENVVQYQYLSKGPSARWMIVSKDDYEQARREGFEVREMIPNLAPRWIVNDHGELGMLIGNRAFFMYKGNALEYTGGDDSPTRFRYVDKREFGESGPQLEENNVEAHDWMTLPGLPKDYDREPRYYLSHSQFGSKQVTKAEWIREERAAGFYPKCSSTDSRWYTDCATGGFSGNNISGHIVY